MENKIIYLPIAVRGKKYFSVESNAFINQGNYIHKKHGLRDGGKFVPLASKTIVTYDPTIDTDRDAIVEENAVARAFVAGMELAETLTTKVVPGAPSVEDSNTPIVDIPIGIFCKNLFPDHPVCQTGGTDTTFVELVAVKGYIETAKIGDPEKNWDYFVAMEKSRFLDLKTSFEKLCNGMQERNSPKIADLVLRVIESLTGDVVDRSDVKDYFKKKEAIPLVGETLLSGIRELDTAIKNDDRDELFEYAKDYCRSATLLSMMLSEKIVKNPVEDANSGGDLIWDASNKKYSIKNEIDHNWYYKDIYNLGLFFVPLNYLPQKRS
jgi:hypothetical protein